MPYYPNDYGFEYDDDILVCDCFILKTWHHTWFDHIEGSKVVDINGLKWDYAIPYEWNECLEDEEMEEGDLCL